MNARDIRQKYHLEKILTEVNCNLGALTLRRLFSVLPASLAGNTFTIKAHSGATAVGDLFMNTGWMKTTYIYRDPRDALLSAMDFGKRTLDKGHPNAFSHLTTLDDSIDFMLRYCVIWDSWITRKSVLSARYEDLLKDYDSETDKLAGFLGLNKGKQAVNDAIEKYRPGQAKEGRDGLHFYKGQVGRFRERFDRMSKRKWLISSGHILPEWVTKPDPVSRI